MVIRCLHLITRKYMDKMEPITTDTDLLSLQRIRTANHFHLLTVSATGNKIQLIIPKKATANYH